MILDATEAAHAPVPQARVSPAPLSQTRIFILFLLTTSTNSTLVLLGKKESISINGPYFSTGNESTSETNTMQCGFPIETHVTLNVVSDTFMGRLIISPDALAGMSLASNTGAPMSTVISPFFAF